MGGLAGWACVLLIRSDIDTHALAVAPSTALIALDPCAVEGQVIVGVVAVRVTEATKCGAQLGVHRLVYDRLLDWPFANRALRKLWCARAADGMPARLQLEGLTVVEVVATEAIIALELATCTATILPVYRAGILLVRLAIHLEGVRFARSLVCS